MAKSSHPTTLTLHNVLRQTRSCDYPPYVTLPPSNKCPPHKKVQTSHSLDCSTSSRDSNNAKSVTEVASANVAPPDGGWGWVVVFCAFLVSFLMTGLLRSYGVLYVAIMDTFPETSASEAAWIPGILNTLSLLLSPVSSLMANHYGNRRVVFAGGIVSALGMSLSYFAESVHFLVFTAGVLTGVGATLAVTSSILAVGQYFEKQRAMANSLSLCGSGLGGLVMPKVIHLCLESYGLRGTFLIFGSLLTHICVGASLLRPLPHHYHVSSRRHSTPSVDEPESTCFRKVYRCIYHFLAFELLKNRLFVLLSLSVILMSTGTPHVLFFLPDHGEVVGFAKSDSGSLLSFTAFGDLFGRIFLGCVSDRKFLPRRYEYIASIVLSAMVVLVLPSVTSYTFVAACAFLFGIGTGSWQCLIPVLLADYLGNSKLGGSLALVRVFQGLANLVVPPIAGHMNDSEGHYQTVFYFMGGCMTMSFLVTLLLSCAEKRHASEEPQES